MVTFNAVKVTNIKHKRTCAWHLLEYMQQFPSRWRYIPGWTLASSTICLQASRLYILEYMQEFSDHKISVTAEPVKHSVILRSHHHSLNYNSVEEWILADKEYNYSVELLLRGSERHYKRITFLTEILKQLIRSQKKIIIQERENSIRKQFCPISWNIVC